MRSWPLVIVTIAQQVCAQAPLAPDPPKFARVAGTVIDAQGGGPLSHVVVCFILDRNGYYDGTNDYCDETDAQGSFHRSDLLSGRYTFRVGRPGYVAAEPVAEKLSGVVTLNAGDELRDIRFRMYRAGVITGRVLYADGEPFSSVELTVHRGISDDGRTTTNDLGEYRFVNLSPGDYSVHIESPHQTGDCSQFANRRPRLYAVESASRDLPSVHVAYGQQATYPDLMMVPVTPHRVSGRIVGEAYPLPGNWYVMVGNRRMQVNNSDGSFSICGLPPGEFVIRAYAKTMGRTFAGELPIHIADEDLKGLEVIPEASGSIRARIEVEENVPLDLSRAQIYTSAIVPNPHGSVPQPRREPDGTFIIDEVYTADYRFFLSPLPPGSYLKSVRLRGQELVDAPLAVHGGENIDGLVFTVSTKAATLAGIVKDEAGNTGPEAAVILQPDPLHIDPDIHRCFTSTDPNGGFTCPNLAPGKYRVAAWRMADWLNAQEIVRSSGMRVDVPESGEVSVPVPLFK